MQIARKEETRQGEGRTLVELNLSWKTRRKKVEFISQAVTKYDELICGGGEFEGEPIKTTSHASKRSVDFCANKLIIIENIGALAAAHDFEALTESSHVTRNWLLDQDLFPSPP